MGKTIGIITAMDLELSSIKDHYGYNSTSEYANNIFYVNKQKELSIVMVCAGQGKTNAAIFSQILIKEYRPDYVINIGICGGIGKDSSLFDIYAGEKYCHYDIRKQQSLEKFPNKFFYEGDSFLINQLKVIDAGIKVGTFGTGEGFVSDRRMKQDLIRDFKIDCVDMESAAIAQCCFLNNVNFLSVRIVSDKADRKATMTSEEFQIKTMESLFDLVAKMIVKIQ